MNCFQIMEVLQPSNLEKCLKSNIPYVAVLSLEEWMKNKDQFQMGIDLDMVLEPGTTKIEVNYDSLTGSIAVLDRSNVSAEPPTFAFALDERGIVFIDQTEKSMEFIKQIKQTKKWRFPSLERFIYDFLELLIYEDQKMLDKWELAMEGVEKEILAGKSENIVEKINDVRGDILDLRIHYEQLMDLGQELEENENSFFKEENLRYFHMFTTRVERFNTQLMALRDYSMQIRDLYQSEMDVKQNKIMAVLTIITTIFFPLSIITGWYGMNFTHMPELEYWWSYPVLALICLVIVISGLVFFKKKKML